MSGSSNILSGLPFVIFGGLLLLVLIFALCSGSDSGDSLVQSTQIPLPPAGIITSFEDWTATPAPTEVPPEPTATETAQPAPPTPTRFVPPVAAATLLPTATATLIPTSTPTSTPTPTATPEYAGEAEAEDDGGYRPPY